MSFSMSPPQKPAPAPPASYTSYRNPAASPTTNSPYGPPPPKRQRTSPDPRSPPNGGPGWVHSPHGLANPAGQANAYAPTNSAVHSPYASSPNYSQSPHQNSFHTPQPYPYQQSSWQSQTPSVAHAPQMSPPAQLSREAMPPPPVPKREEREDKVGVEDIGDSLFGSGINLKDEENYMHSMYNNRHHQYNSQENQSFASNQTTSFGSSTMSANNSFNLLTQGTPIASQDAAAGTLGPTKSQEDVEIEQRRKREAAARDAAERKQHHLNHQFLNCNNVRKRMDTLAKYQGVTLNMTGVFIRQADPETSVMLNEVGKEGIVAAKEETKRPESVVNQGMPFEQILSLVSLAAGERLRGLMDDAFVLARARRYGDNGRVVPPEFADIAEGDGRRSEVDVVPESITGTQWDKIPDQDMSSPKDAEMAGGADRSRSNSSAPQAQPTVAFQGRLNGQLRALAERDRQAEKERLRKREARKRKNSDSANPADTPPADATASEAAVAPVDQQPKMTKKEQMRQQKEKNSSTEAQLHHSTNQTAAMMAMGKKASKYSWMTGGSAALPTNRFAKPTTSAGASGSATPTKSESQSAVVASGAAPAMVKTGSAQGKAAKAPEWGEWRESGKGIDMRDWILVLERDGKEKAALVKALHKLEG